jgi:hypothetical protein
MIIFDNPLDLESLANVQSNLSKWETWITGKKIMAPSWQPL